MNSIVTLPDGGTVSHYYNLIDETEIDLTKQQFPEGLVFSDGHPKTKGFASTREYRLSYRATRQRYEALKSKVKHALTSDTAE